MLGTMLRDVGRLLTFRSMSDAVRTHPRAYLVCGLVFTWLAGVGRYWDNPRAHLLQHLGLGSVLYVFVLAGMVFALVAPLGPRRWTYRNVLTFVTLTAPPALLYAIPVERFLPLQTAGEVNAWFLAVVAAWRVGLYARFLHTTAGLSAWRSIVGTLLPLCIVLVVLTMANLEHVVFELMGGISPEQRSANDMAYDVVVTLTFFALLLLAPLLLVYLGMAVAARLDARDARDARDALVPPEPPEPLG